jgi:hypothetical protein
MSALNFIIAVIALIIAILAYKRAGGRIDLPKDLREKTADTLAKMEQALRRVEGKTAQDKGETGKEG